jgi:hypothetical protein
MKIEIPAMSLAKLKAKVMRIIVPKSPKRKYPRLVSLIKIGHHFLQCLGVYSCAQL